MLRLTGLFSDPRECCRLVCALFALSVAITFSEKLVLSRDYGPDGWFAWKIFRFDRIHLPVFRTFPRTSEAIFGRFGMSMALTLGLAGVMAMCLAPVSSLIFTLGVLAIFMVCLLIHFRSTYGGDGSQQMNLLIGAAILLGFNPWVRPAVGGVSLLFVAAQSLLAYLTSGFSKLISPIWMRGDPLVGILSTKAYGSEMGLALVMRVSRLRHCITVGLVVFETIFPICLILPKRELLSMLLCGVAFHIANALFMGLNTFLWSFLATYPAVCYTWLALRNAHSLNPGSSISSIFMLV